MCFYVLKIRKVLCNKRCDIFSEHKQFVQNPFPPNHVEGGGHSHVTSVKDPGLYRNRKDKQHLNHKNASKMCTLLLNLAVFISCVVSEDYEKFP